MKIPFQKYQGTGNDFVIIDQRAQQYLTTKDQSIVEKMCDRRFGIGADGVMLINQSDKAPFEMIYFNSDGRESTMCGNGGRCIAHMAYTLGVIAEEGSFVAIDGLHKVKILPEASEVSLQMIDVSDVLEVPHGVKLDTGSPHLIHVVLDVEEVDVVTEGARLRYHELFQPDGLNVNFLEQVGDDHIRVRTYERGVEDETLSCGTGVTAAAIVHAIGGLQAGQSCRVTVDTRGGELTVEFTCTGKGYEDVWLTGPVRQVFDGVYRC